MVSRAEVLWEKGTDRTRFFNGLVDKYTRQDLGSSFLPGEISDAFLWAQIQEAQSITDDRIISWGINNTLLAKLESDGFLRRPYIPSECS